MTEQHLAAQFEKATISINPGRYCNIRNLMVMKSTIKNAGTATDCKQHQRQARKTGSEIRDHGSAHNRTAVFCGRCFTFNDNQMVCDAVLAFEVAYPGDESSAFLPILYMCADSCPCVVFRSGVDTRASCNFRRNQ